MGTFLVTVAFVLAIGMTSTWVTTRAMRRRGIELPPKRRRSFRLMMTFTLLVAAISASCIATGHVAVGSAILIAALILPEFYFLPKRLRRARQKAAAAGARREGRATR